MAFAYTKLMQAMVAAGVVTPTDPYFNLVTLLLPGNGTNGAQNNTFLDSSSNNFTITRNGNTTQGTFSPFSQTGWGNYFGATSTYLSFGSNSAFSFGTGAYTVEFWYYPTALSGSRWLCSNDASGGINIYMDGTQLNWGYWGVGGFITVNNAFNLNQWNHVALCRASTSSNQASVFINGTRAANGTDSRDWTVNGPFVIGGSSQSSNSLDGYISNLRVVKGTDVYGVANTSYTVPTTPLTAITNTSLLTCQSNRFIDNSSNAFAITVNGTPSVQAFSPFAPTAAYSASTNGGSGYFDGTGDYLTVASNSAFTFTGDFTWEGWFYMTANPAQSFSARLIDYNNTGNFLVFSTSDGTDYLGFAVAGTTYTTTTPLPRNQWAHVAVSRSGAGSNNLKLFLNGTAISTQTNTSTITAAQISISNRPGSDGYFTGYMSSYRLTNTGLYTANFTPPTSPPTSASALLLNFTNAGITDATAKNDLETVGNVSISTTQSKFGGSSMYFDGTGYLKPSGNQQLYRFGTGDFTVEMWVYLTSYGTNTRFYDGRPAANGPYLAIQVNTGGFSGTSNALQVYVSSAVRIDAGVAVTLNSWFHLAVCRSGTSTKMFVNGTQSGSTYTDSTDYSGGNAVPTIGASEDGNNKMSGYLDDLRITNGFARYTANFTPTTTTFPLQ